MRTLTLAIVFAASCAPTPVHGPKDSGAPPPSGGGGGGGTATGGSGGGSTGGAGGGGGGSAPADAAVARDMGSVERAIERPVDASSPAEAGPAGDLDRACTPKLTLKMGDTGPKGKIFLDAMGGTTQSVEQVVQEIGRSVCRVLYRRPEEVRPANELELQINDCQGVAGKWGDIGKIGIEICTPYLQGYKGDVAKEIKGILTHEMTHMYQHDDKPEGTWSGLANYYEAGADAVRIRYGYAPDGCRPSKSGNWADHNYCTGGWWWLWVDTKYPDYIYKLNLLLKGRDNHAFTPADATPIAGVSLDALWAEYKTAACCSGSNTTCCK
jgi:hypothetical protein